VVERARVSEALPRSGAVPSTTMLASNLFHGAHASLSQGSSIASGGGVSVDFDGSVLIQFTAFIVLFLVIKPLLLDPFVKLMEEREKRTDGAKAEARSMDEKAGEILKRYEGEIDKVRKVAGEERERQRQEATRLEAKMLEEARVETAQIVAEGKTLIQKEADAIRF
jgi:F-type H+-transporting ATPase subunit b